MTLLQVRNKLDESIQRVLMLRFISEGVYQDDKELSDALSRLQFDLQSNLDEIKLALEAMSAEARA